LAAAVARRCALAATIAAATATVATATTATVTATATAATTGVVAHAAAAGAFADHHAAEHDGLGALTRVRLEAGDDLLRDLALDEPLDVAQETVLVDAHQ
jgi:hypothetical protein